jgi:glycerol-3-phosphate dehydrogenase
MYDLTGGMRIGKVHKRLRHDAARAHMPTLDDRLAWAYLYYDAQTDDARLTLAIARTAALDFGAVMANHAGVTDLRRTGDRVRGAVVDTGRGTIEVDARVVVNATGVWADDLRALEEGPHAHTIRPAKGIHITVPWDKVRNDIAAVVPVPKDRRSVFVVPWPGADGRVGGEGSVTYIGTTDTDYDGDRDDPQCTPEDVAYLLGAINRSLREPLSEADVLGTWAGLRPLISDVASGRTADLSRRHQVTTSPGGMVTVTGGKLTTYREMAEDTVDAAAAAIDDQLPRRAGRSRTRKLALRGAEGWEEFRETDPHLAERYGGESGVLQAMVDADPTLAEPLVPGLPYRRVEALYAARYEMATTLDDVLSRRTRARLRARDATAAAADDVATLLAGELRWSEAERAAQVSAYRAAAEREREAPGLPESVALAGGV